MKQQKQVTHSLALTHHVVLDDAARQADAHVVQGDVLQNRRHARLWHAKDASSNGDHDMGK